MASLHHSACREPAWNDSWIVTVGRALLSWGSAVLLLPLQSKDHEIRVAGLLVNPGLEEISLVRDGDMWHPSLRSAFVSAGLTPPTEGISIGQPTERVTGYVTETSMSISIPSVLETYETWAEPEIRQAAHRRGGFLFIVTHAADPAQLNPDSLKRALASPLTLTGWAQVQSGPNS
jgi:hypothetical protein